MDPLVLEAHTVSYSGPFFAHIRCCAGVALQRGANGA